MRRTLATALLLLTISSTASAEEVIWSTRDLLKDFFRTSERVTYVEVQTAEAAKEVQRLLGYTPKKKKYVVFVGRTADKIDGYAIIDDEQGQHEPITFAVKVSPAGLVERMEVMVYREGYGGEIREERFRKQFAGRAVAGPGDVADGVVAISGATISSKAMTIGVKRAAALISVVQRRESQAHAAPATTTTQPPSGTN